MDKSDIESMASAYYDRLFRAALFMCNNPEDAEDLVQDTFAAAAVAIDRYEERSSPYTWLYAIFLNKFRTWLRKKKKKDKFSLQKKANDWDVSNIAELVPADGEDASDSLLRDERAGAVRKALNELPPHHKDALVLRYLEGMSYEQISAVLDCSTGTVKSRIHYALRKVGDKLENSPSI